MMTLGHLAAAGDGAQEQHGKKEKMVRSDDLLREQEVSGAHKVPLPVNGSGVNLLRIAPDLSIPVEAATQTFAILAKRGAGKALSIDTPLPTPSGWTTMGEVKEGDSLFDENGEVCHVTTVHPIYRDHQCYRVRFSDGAEMVADAEHLWLTEDLLSRLAAQNAKHYKNRGRGDRKQCIRWRYPKLHTTEEIAATLQHGSRGDFNHAVATTGPLALPEVELPIDPYVLGVWLGDGTGAGAVITTKDQEVLEEITRRGYRVGCNLTHILGLGPVW